MKQFFKSLLFILLIAPTTLVAQTGNDSYFEISKNLDVFASLFKELNENYVDPIEPGKVMKTGIEAMLFELDPYTNFISEDDIQDFRIRTTGEYGGIGSTVVVKDDYIAIDQPYENSPTLKAGLKAGDLILAIDGKSIKNKAVSDVSGFLKGAPGTQVKLKVRDAFTNEEVERTVTRGKIKISSVPYAGMIGQNNDVGYARLTQFTSRCSNDLLSALDSLKKANTNMKAVVLDLRSNPGGLLDEAIKVCNLFLPNGQLVVSTKGKASNSDREYKTRGTAWDKEIPVAVLINGQSASASEIVAGTIQDLDRGVVIGQKSFGKGLVQTTRKLSFKSQLKVTTAKYYTPSGRCIQAIDYSLRDEDGSVGKIPDSLKTEFKTKGGRSVWDGGGIEPDINLAKKKWSALLPGLSRKFYLFDYATKYAKEHPSIASASNFKLTDKDFTDFSAWLGDKDFGYESKTELALKKVKQTAEKEDSFDGIEADYNKLMASVAHDKKQDLVKNKEQVLEALQTEIVSRYYYRTGRLANNISSDEEITKAIEVLDDTAAYSELLRVD